MSTSTQVCAAIALTLALSSPVFAGSYNLDYKRYSPDRNCCQMADSIGLGGDERRKFMNDCLDPPNRY